MAAREALEQAKSAVSNLAALQDKVDEGKVAGVAFTKAMRDALLAQAKAEVVRLKEAADELAAKV